MELTIDLDAARAFAVALLIGALVGTEREKHKAEDDQPGIGGLRTFIFFGAVGAIAAWLGERSGTPWLLVAVVACVSLGVFAGYVVQARTRPDALGMTTELAAIAVVLLGAMTSLGHAAMAIGLGIMLSAVLAYKEPLHGLVQRIGREDMLGVLRLLIATFIVLPLLPDRTIDPWHALNPYKLWLLVVLITGLSLVGYVATRWLGSGKGSALTGLTGGLVSSTAVTLTFARRSREAAAAQLADALASGILVAWAVMFVRMVIEVVVVNAALVPSLIVSFGAMAAAALLAGGICYARAARRHERNGSDGVPLANPFSLTSAAKFAAFFAVVLMIVALVKEYYPGSGLLVVAALAGLTDVDAITLSMADYARGGDVSTAVRAIVIAALTNTMVKAGLVVALGAPALRRRVLISCAAVLAAGAVPLMLG
jgi:uncharacterized membrane protein (DUF4010 family)